MKVHIDGVNFVSRTGPNTFGQRLARGLFESGHEVVIDDGIEADVSLVFIEPSGKRLAKRVVQRLDGIWFKPDEFSHKNVEIKELYDRADRVVWQSQFDRDMTTHWWGDRPGVVIRNGINTGPVQVSNVDLLALRDQFKRIFVCSANWHPQKRLRANIEFFLNQVSHEPNCCLIVMGANPDCQVAHPRIFYTGSIPHDLCLEVYRIADWMIHLAWLDHCPNVVIEALSQETPVICSSEGGTKELIGEFGVVIPETPYEFQLADYDKPPEIKGFHIKLPDRSSLGSSVDISMEKVVRSYVELFEEII